jgi:hypothetical protein
MGAGELFQSEEEQGRNGEGVLNVKPHSHVKALLYC